MSVLSKSFAWLLLCFVLATAQTGPSGGLSGTVKDPSGQSIPAAQVEVRNQDTGLIRQVETNLEGYWEARFLPTGNYTITIEAGGFQKSVLSDIPVEAAVVSSVPAALKIGAVTDAVTVVGEVPLVTANCAATSRQIETRELLQVPTATRSFTHLLSAAMGVSADLPPVLVNGNGNISPSVNGLRTTSNSVQFNGVDATSLASNEGSLTDNISPAPETLEEVKLQTSMYDASVGRSGAAISSSSRRVARTSYTAPSTTSARTKF